jgi:hypothetical protein
MYHLEIAMRSKLVMQLPKDAHKFGLPFQAIRSDGHTIRELCETAMIPCRASGNLVDFKMIFMIDSEDNFLYIADDGPIYSIGRNLIKETNSSDISLRVLEIMAYTFNEYTSRECLNRQGYFEAPADSYSNAK